MEMKINIDGKEVGFKATALTPRIYRHKIGRDMIGDMNKLRKAYAKVEKAKTEEEKMDAGFSGVDLEIFENVAWIMAKQFNPEIENTADEWLDSFEIFSIYEILPKILQLWNINTTTTSVVKKNLHIQRENRMGQSLCYGVQN